jgi:5-methylcytosine-specific restriction endonuclease McrA
VTVAAQRYVCDEHRQPAYQARPTVSRACDTCGTLVQGTAAKRKCTSCIAKRAQGRKKHRKRAQAFGVAYEPINPIDVFERDGWRCQICLKPTPKQLRGKNKPRSPELDHIVAISRGGPHTRSNVQCTCRACNGAKGAGKPQGQMSLMSMMGPGGG